MRVRTTLTLLVALAASAAICNVVVSSDHVPASTPRVIFTKARQYHPNAWMRGAERFPLGATIVTSDNGNLGPLVTAFEATADPDVSFDGKRVLFSGKQKSSDPWQIWEVAVTGGTPRRVTSSAQDAVRPMYLPDERFVYARKEKGLFVLEAASLQGGNVVRLSYAPGSALPSDVLRDGRILFQAGQPVGASTTPELYTVYSDGSGVESYRCDHGHARYAGKQVASGDIVFTHGTALGRFTSPVANEVAVAAPAGDYAGDVVETTTGEWLLPWRKDSKSNFEIRRLDQRTGAMAPLASEAGIHLLQPAVVAPRPVPNRHPSGLHDWRYANLLTLNAYTSKFDFAEGSIASVRVYTMGANGKPTLLGRAPVEKDGSLYVRVPGDVPLQFELQDADGKTLKRQAGWFWARAGEQRVCVGCHAGPEHAPENAVPAVLLKSTVPTDLSAH